MTVVGRSVASALARVRAVEAARERTAELTLVNEIGRGLAQQLEFDAIIELVGERVREQFDATSMFIATYDPTTDLMTFRYELDEGRRVTTDPIPLGAGLTSEVIRRRAPVRLGTYDELTALGAIQSGVDAASWLGVPILVGDEVLGVLALESLEQHKFDDSTQRLLATVASSMGVALKNARLFDETKRLLTDADERAAELAIINEVQQGLAAQLEIQAMYDLVGERLREIFDAQVLDIGVLDKADGLIHFPFAIERGVRFPDEPISPYGFRKHVMDTREPMLVNEDTAGAAAAVGGALVLQGEAPKSTLWVPLLVGGEATGVISLQNLDREHAFTRVGRSRPADDRVEPLGRPRERPPVRRDEPPAARDRRAGRPAGDHHDDPAGPRGADRHPGDVRPRGRPARRAVRRAGVRHRHPRPRRGRVPLPVHDRARGAVRGHRDAVPRHPQARDGVPRAARDQRARVGTRGGAGATRRPPGRGAAVDAVGAAHRRRRGGGRRLGAEPRSRARVPPGRCQPAPDARREPERLARDGAPRRGDEPAGRRDVRARRHGGRDLRDPGRGRRPGRDDRADHRPARRRHHGRVPAGSPRGPSRRSRPEAPSPTRSSRTRSSRARASSAARSRPAGPSSSTTSSRTRGRSTSPAPRTTSRSGSWSRR